MTVFDESTKNQTREHKILGTKYNTKIDKLLPAHWYSFQLRVVTINGVKSPKRTVLVHTELESHTELKVGNITETSATLKWNYTDPLTKTIRTLFNTQTKKKVKLEIEAGENSEILTGLSRGTLYDVKIQQFKNKIFSDHIGQSFRTDITYITPVMNIAYITEKSTFITWKPIEDTDVQYVFQWKPAAQGRDAIYEKGTYFIKTNLIYTLTSTAVNVHVF